MIAAVRLAFGLLTIFPVGDPGPVTRRTAGRAVAFFPLVGLVLGVLGAVMIKLARASYHTYSLQLLPAAMALALLALLSRGMHLDGLADVTDGLGADVASLAFRDDEVDLRTRAGTRITYVLGREDAALTLAQSGLKDLNLNDGSVEYVDLRFENKLFVKRRGAAETAGS